MKNKFLKFSCALAALLCVFWGLRLSVLQVEAQEEIIKIKTIEDLLEFVENCTVDSWSKDKSVVLQADIYMEDVAFQPIATFGGTFDGKGHSIIGLEITESVSPAGFFGVLQEGAVVKNLNVLGKVMPSGENDTVGGIVGENYGQLKNCTFTGAVYGTCNVGGLAGVNGVSGSIQNCRVSGDIQGNLRTGGVTGFNQGIIEKCKNDAGVNIAKVDPQISMTDVDLEISMDVTQWNDIGMMDAASDTGGIAGYSAGAIHECSNTGVIGYPHIGYNLGGIAGRNCGYVAACENSGGVYGRKDSGGIVGQMEPYVLVELTESAVGEIGRELDTLTTTIERAKKHSNESSAALKRRINKIESYSNGLEKLLKEFSLPELEIDSENQDTTEKLKELLQIDQIMQVKVQADLLKKQVELLAGETVNSAGTLKNDISSIMLQTEVFSGTVENVMAEMEQLSISDFVADISQWNPQKAALGKVSDCTNNGIVYGDKNVGGIVGIMSMEYEMDPEDDLADEFSMKERRQYQLTDILCESVNYGSVLAKKDNVGGICGRMDLGLIFECENYGTVSSQNGDYVGGIAGLTGSMIRECFVKCSLSGLNYIGGVVGSGITEDVTGESSLVSQCYTMVDITDYQQFVGAVAGVHRGSYEECYFVNEDIAGINRISYTDKAEQITYETLLDIKDLPKEFERFTLTFVANDNVVEQIPFEYGDSIDRESFPMVPVMMGYQGCWDADTLEHLHKDTVVTAVYVPSLTAIASKEVREDGRPIFLAEGQFSVGSNLNVTAEEKSFQPKEMQSFLERLHASQVVEQWSVEVPEDGLLIRTLRYLAPENNADAIEIYIRQDGDWKLAHKESAGSYLVFNIAGCDAEIAVVTTNHMWGYWIAAVLMIVLVVGGGIWMIRKKKTVFKGLMVCLTAVFSIILIGILLLLNDGKLMSGIGAYQLLQQYLEQPEQAWKLSMQSCVGEENLAVEAEICITELDGQRVTCIKIADAGFFYSDGILYLENGDAYQTSEISADYGNMLQQIVKMYEQLDMELLKEDQSKVYTIMIKEENARELLRYLLPEISEGDFGMQQLKAELHAKEDVLTNITLSAKGKLQNEEKTKYQVSAVLAPVENGVGQLEIPEMVKTAIQDENKKVQAVISKDVFRLYLGWKSLAEQNTMGAQVFLTADCGPLTLSEEFSFISSKVKGERINSVRKDGFVIYFDENTVCSENGYGVTAKRAQAADAVELLGIAYELCLQGNFRCLEVNDSFIYSVALDETGMEKISGLIAKESQDMAIRFENGSVQLVIQDNLLDSIRFACDGEMDILLAKVPVALSAQVELQNEAQYMNYSIPEKVLEKLLQED